MSAPYLPPVMSDVVIDISHYETVEADFLTTAATPDENGNIVAAVIMKATQGLWTDPTFQQRAGDAQAAGLLVGAYLFLDASASPADQAAHFLTVTQAAAVTWLGIDWEPYPASQASQTQAEVCETFIEIAVGRPPTLYTIRSMLTAPSATLSRCPLWLAEYGSRPICPPGFSAWQLWQHTDGHVGSVVAPVPGIGPCDRSKFAGTVDELKMWWDNPRLRSP